MAAAIGIQGGSDQVRTKQGWTFLDHDGWQTAIWPSRAHSVPRRIIIGFIQLYATTDSCAGAGLTSQSPEKSSESGQMLSNGRDV